MEMKAEEKRWFFLLPLAVLGRKFTLLLGEMGALIIFLAKSILLIFRPKQIPIIFQQIYFIGARSANIVALVGLFTGMVLGLQIYYALIQFGAEGALGISFLSPVKKAISFEIGSGHYVFELTGE